MPSPDPRARAERRRAEKLLETSYGWPEVRRRSRRRRLVYLSAVLAFLGVLTAIIGPENVPAWSTLPVWWVPLAFLTAAALLLGASRLEE